MDVFAKAREKFPLPQEEEGRLTQVLVGSVLATTVAAIICTIVLCCLRGEDLWQAVTNGWARAWADALAIGWPWSLACAIALAALMFAIDRAAEGLAWRTAKGREEVLEVRRGLSGEIARLPLGKIAPLMLGVGCAEEVGFRFAVIGVVMVVAEPVLGFAGAAIIAVIASTAVFTLMHTQYHCLYANLVVTTIGLLLGTFYVLTGMLAAVALAHALYDFGITAFEARRMARDPDYFQGEAPVNAVKDEIDRQIKEREGGQD